MSSGLRTTAFAMLLAAPGLFLPGVASGQEGDNAIFHHSLLDIDVGRTNSTIVGRWDGAGWVGTDFDRLWWSTSGEGIDSELEAAEVELLYGRYVRRFWDMVVGYRHAIQPVSQGYLTFGLMGLAPYWFEVGLLGSISSHGRPSVELEAENDLYVTQRLVLTVGGSLGWLITDDDTFDLPAGIGDVEVGLRARYEIRRKFAPYLDLVWERVPQTRAVGPFVGAAKGFRLGVGLRLIY